MRNRLLIAVMILNINYIFSQDYIGYYWTPDLGIGFFREKIVLYKDSTFHWIYSGDLIYNESIGNYKVNDNIVILDFKPHYDTIISWKIQFGSALIDTSFLPPTPIIYDRDEKIPKKYLYRDNSLYIISEKGRKSHKPHFIKVDH
jgi:hypothetical protein